MTITASSVGGFGEQLSRSQTDLARIVREGPRERAWLPASHGLLLRGKRHLVAAPAKSGKTQAFLTHAVAMALEGARIAVLDRENGADEYARRLRTILEARRLSSADAQRVQASIAHYDWPPVSLDAVDDPTYAQHFRNADLVIFDSSRAFLTACDLDEDSSNDYARFMAALVDPLHRAGVATLMLDNAGHEGTRARGSSAKTDLNEVVFRLATAEPFAEDTTGTLKLERTHSRFGGGPSWWFMRVGGGVYGRWEPGQPGRSAARDQELLDAIVAVLADTGPLGENKLLTAVRARGIKTGAALARSLLGEWTSDAASPIAHGAHGYRLRDTDLDTATRPDTSSR
jgi:hypothetical protein